MSVCDVIVGTLIGSPLFPPLFSRLCCWTDCHFCCFGAYEDSSASFTLFSALHPDPHSGVCFGTSGVETAVVWPSSKLPPLAQVL